MVIINEPKAAGIVALCLLFVNPPTACAKTDACSENNIEIRQIAADAPGMSKSNAFFAILNVGSAPCRLSAQLVRIGETALTVDFHDNTKVDFVLPPLRDNHFIHAKDVIGLTSVTIAPAARQDTLAHCIFNWKTENRLLPTMRDTTLRLSLRRRKSFRFCVAGFSGRPMRDAARQNAVLYREPRNRRSKTAGVWLKRRRRRGTPNAYPSGVARELAS